MTTTQKTSGLAIASLILGLCFFIPFGFLLAIIFGFIALSNIKGSDGQLKGKGMAITGLVLGFAWIVMIPVIGLLAAMAIPAFQKVRETSLEKKMENNGRQIASASQQYMLENGVESVEFADLGEYVSFDQIFNDSCQSGDDTTVEVDGSFELFEPTMERRYVFDANGTVTDVFDWSHR